MNIQEHDMNAQEALAFKHGYDTAAVGNFDNPYNIGCSLWVHCAMGKRQFVYDMVVIQTLDKPVANDNWR